jgi:hypothetical protein
MNSQPPNQSASASLSSAQPSASTGPRTEAGKSVSSQNARKHDLCSRTLRLSPEEWNDYNDMAERYRRDLNPAGDVEQTLIDEICFNYWRLQQAREAELEIILKNPTDLRLISLYIRYRTGYERAFYKALDTIHKTQRERRNLSARSAAAPLAAAPLAAAVRSAKSRTCPAPQSEPTEIARPEPIPAGALCSANEVLDLEDQLESHILENRVRAEFALPPLEIPGALVDQFNRFVSQNPASVPDRLLEMMKKAA